MALASALLSPRLIPNWMLCTPARPFRWLARAAGGLLFVTLLGACGGADGTPDADIHNPRLVQTESGERYFMGTLVNRRDAPISIAEIEVALYDDEGSRLETMRIQVEDIPARDSVDFGETINSDLPIQQAQVQRVLIP